jgi:hypothetical protein
MVGLLAAAEYAIVRCCEECHGGALCHSQTADVR